MKGALKKAVVAEFDRRLRDQSPHFVRLKRPTDSPVWKWNIGPSLAIFVLLQPFPDDKFAVEIAWSEDGAFPWTDFGRTLVTGSAGRDRVSQRDEGSGLIWDLNPEATAARNAYAEAYMRGEAESAASHLIEGPPISELKKRVPAVVEDAIRQLVELGFPLLKEVAEHRGLKWE